MESVARSHAGSERQRDPDRGVGRRRRDAPQVRSAPPAEAGAVGQEKGGCFAPRSVVVDVEGGRPDVDVVEQPAPRGAPEHLWRGDACGDGVTGAERAAVEIRGYGCDARHAVDHAWEAASAPRPCG